MSLASVQNQNDNKALSSDRRYPTEFNYYLIEELGPRLYRVYS